MMKKTKKIISGKEYLYLYDEIYIAKGNRVLKNKSLGPTDSLVAVDVANKTKNFQEHILSEEIQLRTAYWEKKIQDPLFLKYAHIKKIETRRTNLYKITQDIGSIATSAMKTAFLVDFIYNSNAIEGSKLPRETVAEQVTSGSTTNAEVGNTAKAIYYVDNHFSMNISNIKKTQAILLAHQPENIGIRTEKVVVGNGTIDEEVTDWESIPQQLKELLQWYKQAKKTWYPPELAFTFYYRFERIHPFADGNGRTGRLIMNKILKEHRYHPIIIWTKRRQAHMNAFTKYGQGKRGAYYKFMVDQFIKTHQIYLDKTHTAIDFEKMSKIFLQPSE